MVHSLKFIYAKLKTFKISLRSSKSGKLHSDRAGLPFRMNGILSCFLYHFAGGGHLKRARGHFKSMFAGRRERVC